MCSITDQITAASSRATVLAALVEHHREIGRLVAELLRGDDVDGSTGEGGEQRRVDLGSLPPDAAADLAVALLASADTATAAATALTGHVTATTGPGTGTLIGGRYASARRWLEVEAGLSPFSAKAVIARGKDLREHSAPVREAWLSGAVSGDQVRELTCGVTGMLATLPTTREEKQRLRAEALEVLLPVARAGTTSDLKRAVGKLRLLAESAVPRTGEKAQQAAVEAYDDQSLTCVQVGSLFRLEAWLLPEPAAAAMTVIDQYARRIVDRDPQVHHDPACPLASPPPSLPPGATSFPSARWCTCGGSAAAGVTSRDHWPHLLAVAFGEVMTGQLDDGKVGSHHGIAPHVTVQVDVETVHAGLGGELTTPGADEPVGLSWEAVRRILCDSDVTPVVVRKLLPVGGPSDARTHADDHTGEHISSDADHGIDVGINAAAGADRLARLLMNTAVAVLYVGRTQRTVTARQRRALEARDRHCIFPGCRAHPRRCQAHHVQEWEHDGPTDLDNLCLLCPRHHISVHEGGWTISRTPGASPHQTGCWTFTPPRTQP